MNAESLLALFSTCRDWRELARVLRAREWPIAQIHAFVSCAFVGTVPPCLSEVARAVGSGTESAAQRKARYEKTDKARLRRERYRNSPKGKATWAKQHQRRKQRERKGSASNNPDSAESES